MRWTYRLTLPQHVTVMQKIAAPEYSSDVFRILMLCLTTPSQSSLETGLLLVVHPAPSSGPGTRLGGVRVAGVRSVGWHGLTIGVFHSASQSNPLWPLAGHRRARDWRAPVGPRPWGR